MELKLCYEDPWLVFCVKPPGVLSEGDGLPALLSRELGGPFYCVHRLDKDTGGLMVYARTGEAAAALSRLIAAGGLDKRYLAVAQGCPEPPEGRMRDLLYRDAARNKSYVVTRMRRGVREAALDYALLERAGGFSLVEVRLLTGRSHQIRVQFASRGMPLAGDRRYGSSRRDCGLALWARQLALVHPFTGQSLSFSAAPPPVPPWTDFKSL